MIERLQIQPRADWRQIVQSQGLVYADEITPDAPEELYWDESAFYSFGDSDIDHLEATTELLHEMSVEAAGHILADDAMWSNLGLPDFARTIMQESWRNRADPREQSIYGRFDLVFDGTKPAVLLEYNADTPASLFESAVTQWTWLEDTHPTHDQCNMIHERLVQGWQQLINNRAQRVDMPSPQPVKDRPSQASFGAPGDFLQAQPNRNSANMKALTVHFAAGENEPAEDWITVAYLRDTAREAGIQDVGLTMESIGWDPQQERFVGEHDESIDVCFKMYPWDWMLHDDFGRTIREHYYSTQWIEPLWKTLLSSKTLLAALWHVFPGHANLLPAYIDSPRDLKDYAAKPVFGWEGAGIELHKQQQRIAHTEARHTVDMNTVYQQYVQLPHFDGNNMIIGSWVINGHAAGIGVRESKNLITDRSARFVPHIMNAPRAGDEQIKQWLEEQ